MSVMSMHLKRTRVLLNLDVYVWCSIAAIAAMAAFLIRTIAPGQDWDGDFALYIMNARNIVQMSSMAIG